MDKATAYILATGPSMLSLAQPEKDYLNRQRYKLAMNTYILAYEKVGVLPSDLFLSDYSPPSLPLFIEMCKKASNIVPKVNYYVKEDYALLFTPTIRLFIKGLNFRYSFWKKHKYWIPLSNYGIHLIGINTLELTQHPECSFYWGHSLKQPLLHYRGSLTTAINLASLIYPVKKIKLVGVDLNTYQGIALQEGMQYEEKVKNYFRWHETLKAHDRAREKDIHMTAMTHDGFPGVQSIIPEIRQQLKKNGCELYCCNPNSLLVSEGVCEYAPILD